MNARWKHYRELAPLGARAYIDALFVKSLLANLEPGDDDWRAVCTRMDTDDWKYLANNCGNQMARARYGEAVRLLKDKGGAVLSLGCEILNPFVNLVKGGAE